MVIDGDLWKFVVIYGTLWEFIEDELGYNLVFFFTYICFPHLLG